MSDLIWVDFWRFLYRTLAYNLIKVREKGCVQTWLMVPREKGILIHQIATLNLRGLSLV